MNKEKQKKETIYLNDNVVKDIKYNIEKKGSFYNFCVENYAVNKTGNRYSIISFPLSDLNKYFVQVIKPMLSKEGITEQFFFEQITKNEDRFIPFSFFQYCYNKNI